MKSLIVFIPLLGSHMALAQLTADSLLPSPASQEKPFVRKQTGKKVAFGLGYGALTYFVYKKQDSDIHHEWQEKKRPLLNGMSRAVSPLGRAKTNWIACGASAGIALFTKDRRLQQVVIIWSESMVVNDVATTSLKNHFQRYRPNTHQPFNSFDGNEGPRLNQSFPSAHTSTAFTTATVFATMYKDKKWVPPVAYSLATLVGLSRIHDDAHWASDVMVGAAVGFLSAKATIGANKWLAKKHIHLYPAIGRHSTVTMRYGLQ